MPTKLYNQSYFSAYKSDLKRNAMYNHEFWRMQKITGHSRGKVLDIGCGLGNFLELFPNSWRKYGTEVSEYARNIAVKKNISFVIPNKNNFFDLVIFRGTIQHLDTPLLEIRTRISQLRPGGWMVFLATPNAGSLYYRLWQDLPMIDEKYNYVIFSDKQLVNILKHFGLKVKKVNYPYLDTPYSNPILDHIYFVLKLLGFAKEFAFWGNIMEIYAYKPE